MRVAALRWSLLVLGLAIVAGCDDSDDGASSSGEDPQERTQPDEGTERAATSEPATGAEQGDGAAQDPWKERSDAELQRALEASLARARKQDKRVLLEFVAPWCDDCREVVRVAKQEPANGVIEERYERLFVNVGRFDRHDELRERHGIDRIAALVVLGPDGERIAKTTLEPLSRNQQLTPQALAAWLRSPEDQPPPLSH